MASMRVRVSRALLERLDGRAAGGARSEGKAAPPSSAGGAAAAAAGPAAEEALTVLGTPLPLRDALAESRRVGGLLLKREAEEASSVGRAAEELRLREYVAPSNAVPCAAEMEDCARCYSGGGDVVGRCAPAVAAYARCAAEAHGAFVAQRA